MRIILAVYMSCPTVPSLSRAEAMFSQRSEEITIPSLIFTQILHRLDCLLDDYQTNRYNMIPYSMTIFSERNLVILLNAFQFTELNISEF